MSNRPRRWHPWHSDRQQARQTEHARRRAACDAWRSFTTPTTDPLHPDWIRYARDKGLHPVQLRRKADPWLSLTQDPRRLP